MRPVRPTALLSALGLFAWCAAAPAHHSFAVYDTTKTLTLKGVVKAFQWANPHCVVWVMVQPDGGEPQEWSIETTSPGVLTRSGWTRKSLNPGDKVSIEYNPLRNASHGGGLTAVTLVDSGKRLEVNFAAAEKPGLN